MLKASRFASKRHLHQKPTSRRCGPDCVSVEFTTHESNEMSYSKDDLVLEALLSIAKQHGEDSEPDHEVGDLQDLLRPMWKLLTAEQRNAFMASEEVSNVLLAATGEDSTICDIEDVDPDELEEAAQYLALPLPELVDHAGRIAMINSFRIRQSAEPALGNQEEGRFVHGNWGHIFFPGGPETMTRIVFDREDNAVVAMEVMTSGTGKWAEATQEMREDVTDSIINANPEALDEPSEFGLEGSDEPPQWAVQYLGAIDAKAQTPRPRG